MDPKDQQKWTGDGVREYATYFGTPTFDDHILFELLTVGVFQVGLSWRAAASKLAIYRRDFAGMAISAVAGFSEIDLDRIAADPDMIRNPRKIKATVSNARAILQLQPEFDSFAAYLWHFTHQAPVTLANTCGNQSPLANQVVKDMKKRGFKFVGPVVTHMFLKAAGIIQDNKIDD